MKAGIVQTNPMFGEVRENTESARGLISTQHADLWVLPELFNTGYQFISKKEVEELAEPVPSGPTTQHLIQIAKTAQTHIVAGLAESAGGQVFNSAVLVGPTGFMACYRKIHLFYEENRWFSPGDRPFQVYELPYKSNKGDTLTCKIGIMICFDWIFPESARTLTLLGADILCHPSNLVLPHCPQAMLTRCLENRVYAITTNRVGAESRNTETLHFIGQSQIVTPKGTILFRAPEDQESIHMVDIDPKTARDKTINSYNDLIKNRAPKFYR